MKTPYSVISSEKKYVPPEKLTPEERKETELLYEAIVSEMRKRFAPDFELLRKAYLFALECHGNVKRKDGTLYVTHPLEVAKILADCGYESDLIGSAMLHDVIEDCNVSVEKLTEKFGPLIANIVDAVSAVNKKFARDPENTKEDLDIMSDVKFLTETTTKNNRKAFYIKLADRLHNLRTIGVFPPEQQKAKAAHTRNILIPVAERMHIFTLIDQLETHCLQIENPELFQLVKSGYEQLLYRDRDVLEGENGLKHYLEKVCMIESGLAGNVVSIEFCERYVDSIYRHLITEVENINDFEKYITKKNIPLYNINLIISDDYDGNAESVFFENYQKLNRSRFGLTITGCDKTMGSGVLYYKLKDRYGNWYRLFIQKESELLALSFGVSVDGIDFEDNIRVHTPYYIDEAAPDELPQKLIRVYKADGSAMLLPEGSSVLDMACKIHPSLGLCCKYAYINNKRNVEMPIHTRLRAGDMVYIESDYKKDKEKNLVTKYIPHATIRWVEYAHTRQAIKIISRYLEKNIENASNKMQVKDATGKSHEIDMACTVLDFCIATEGENAFHVKEAFVNKSDVPVAMSYVLKYGDKVRFRFAEEETPTFAWMKVVKTKHAKDQLVQYFENKYLA